jgi:hypothetical protein
MAGTIVADTLTHSTAGSIATNYVVNGSAKAWVNFNGTGTIAARDSLNLSSLTDNSTGNYTSSWSSALANANYSALYGAGVTGSITAQERLQTISAGSYRIDMNEDNSAAADSPYVMLGIHGDLA